MSEYTHCKVAPLTPEMKAQILQDALTWIESQTDVARIHEHAKKVLKAVNP